MSQFERGGPRGFTPVNNRREVSPLIPNSVSVDAPGLAVTPVVAEEDVGLSLLASLGIAAQTAANVSTLLERRQIRQERAEERLKQADRAVGVRIAQSEAPSLLNRVEAGELAPPPGADDETFFNDSVAEIVGQDASGETVQATSDSLRSAFFNALEKGRQERLSRARADAITAYADAAYVAEDPEQISSLVQSIRTTNPAISERDARKSVYNNALRGAAARDDGSDASLLRFDQLASEATKSGLDPLAVMSIRQTLLSSREQAARDAQAQATDEVFALVNSGVVPLDAVPDFISQDSRLGERQRAELLDNITSRVEKQRQDQTQAIEQNFYDMVLDGADSAKLLGYIESSGLDPKTQLALKTRVEAAIEDREQQVRLQKGQQRALNVNNLRRDLLIGRVGSVDGIGRIVEGMDAPPDSANYITAEEGTVLLRLTEQRADSDAREALQARNFTNIVAGKYSDVVPATPQDDKAILKEMSKLGLIRGEPGAPEGLRLPGLAAEAMNRLGRVPNEISNVIASGIQSDDVTVVGNSLAEYAVIADRAPPLAAGIDMPVLSRARASYVASRVKAAKASGQIDTDEEIQSFVKSLAPDAMRINPQVAKVPQADIMGLLYFGDTNRSSDPEYAKVFGEEVRQKVKDDVVGFLRTSEAEQVFGITNTYLPFVRNTRGVDEPPSYVTDTYRNLVEEEYRIHKSFIPDDKKAIEAAKEQALYRTLERHKPIAWGGRIMFGSEGEPTINARTLRKQAEADLGDDVADKLWDRFTPVWSETIGTKPGWVFYETSDPTSIYRLDNGQPLVLQVGGSNMDIVTEIKNARERRKLDAALQVVNPFRPLGF